MAASRTVSFVSRLTVGTFRRALRVLLHAFWGGVIVFAIALAVMLHRRPDLEVWHEAHLDEEFSVDSPVDSFAGYLELEDRLFAQLDRLVYERVQDSNQNPVNRFYHGSIADPRRFPRNWNRSFELAVDQPRGGVVLVHGMSDSPYSMRRIGQSLHEQGYHVVGLRVPGHGTAPSGLVYADWEDMIAAVALAVRHVRQQVGGAPVYYVGYSNGAALGVVHSLSALEDPQVEAVDGLVLLSPAIGITKFAQFAVWQERLGHVLGLRQLQWNSVLLEYDPFKYGSFALNAGKQSWELTVEIRERMQRLAPTGALDRYPPMLAFQSVVDATVSAPALVEVLFDQLPAGPHELVLFDVNRSEGVEALLRDDSSAWVQSALAKRDADFAVTLVTNRGADVEDVMSRTHVPGRSQIATRAIGLKWPEDIYSLAHVSLPFAPDDPVYGGPDAEPSPGIQLGDIALRGERGALVIAPADLLRLRWNPFFAYLEQRMLDFVADPTAAYAGPRDDVTP